jgi:hypothetical protein
MAISRPSPDTEQNERPRGAVPPERSTSAFDLEAYVARSRAVDLSAIPWNEIPRHPLPPEAVRTLRYMQDIESHTIIYLRSLLATRAIDDPEVATFLACWVYEETFHGIALARFLETAGYPLEPRARPHGREALSQRIEAAATAMVSKTWPDFCAVHMTWGAINELTTLTGYRRLVAAARHPVLTDLLERIIIDESRHFFFYYRQAEIRLQRPVVARTARFLVDRFWAPVGSGVQAREELGFMARYLFSGAEGRAAARKVDDTIRRLPGFASVQLLEAWMDTHVTDRAGVTGAQPGARLGTPYGGHHGHGYH